MLTLNHDLSVHLSLNSWATSVVVLLVIALVALRVFGRRLGVPGWRSFQIEQAEFGLGDQRITLRPNETDRQIAYKIWVELSTRKIGLEIDPEHDVIVEVYNSWHDFFSVTRELIKDIPVSKFRRRDTEKIVRLSIEVLNLGIRPHLTKWQARFRRWYEKAMGQDALGDLAPQSVQQQFPQYAELIADLEKVNGRLIRYREKMYSLVTNL